MTNSISEATLADARKAFRDAYFNADSDDKLDSALRKIHAIMSRASQPVDTGVEREPVCAMCNGTRDDLARGRDPEELCDPCYEDATATITLDSEAVERVIAEIDYQESAPEPKGRFATVRIDDLRALLNLARERISILTPRAQHD